jgi:hypothetical protein
MSRRDRAAWSAISFSLWSRTSDDERPVEIGAFDCRHEVRRALFGASFPRYSVWSRHRRRQPRRDSATPDVHGIGNDVRLRMRELRRARPQVTAMVVLTAITASAREPRSRFRRRFPRM